MPVYSSTELYSYNLGRMFIKRELRKVLFRLHLWLPTSAFHMSMHIVSPGRHSRCPNDGVMNSRASSDSNTIEASNEFITFGCLNIRSITSKFEVLTDVIKDKKIDILSLTETWHDEGSVAFFQLRRQGFTVIDCPRPRVGSAQSSSLHSNHGGHLNIIYSATSPKY